MRSKSKEAKLLCNEVGLICYEIIETFIYWINGQIMMREWNETNANTTHTHNTKRWWRWYEAQQNIYNNKTIYSIWGHHSNRSGKKSMWKIKIKMGQNITIHTVLDRFSLSLYLSPSLPDFCFVLFCFISLSSEFSVLLIQTKLISAGMNHHMPHF